MAKRLTKEQKQEQAVIDLVNKMFEIAGHTVTFEDIKDRNDAWYTDWTMTMAQGDEWIKWGETYLKKKFRMVSKRAHLEMQWISLQWGLKYSDFNL
jgi:hypothetical protein